MRAALSLFLPILTFLALLQSAPPARADYCWRYANTAIQQQKENINRRCGFSGPRWHLDRNRHRLWCNFVSRRVANRETLARRQMLRRCPKVVIIKPRRQPRNDNPRRNTPDRCRDYANRAVEAYNRYSARGCRLSAPRGFTPNYNYCRRVSSMQAEQALSNLIAQGEACLANRRNPPVPAPLPAPQGASRQCRDYAKRAYAIARTIQDICSSGHYQVNYQGDLSACMSWPAARRASNAANGLRALSNALLSCPLR